MQIVIRCKKREREKSIGKGSNFRLAFPIKQLTQFLAWLGEFERLMGWSISFGEFPGARCVEFPSHEQVGRLCVFFVPGSGFEFSRVDHRFHDPTVFPSVMISFVLIDERFRVFVIVWFHSLEIFSPLLVWFFGGDFLFVWQLILSSANDWSSFRGKF